MLILRRIAFIFLGLVLSLPLTASNRQNLVQQLDREVIALTERNRILQNRLETCDQNSGPSPIYTELVQVFSSTEVKVSRQGARTLVSIPAAVLFSSSAVQVRQEATMVLDMLATALSIHPDQAVWIIGHTGDLAPTGSLRNRFRSNWELSAFQAAALLHTLTERFGLDPKRFTISGRGAEEPIADNDTPAGRNHNNRIVIVILPSTDFP